MARIRTIKPEFWSDEKLSHLDPLARLVYVGLISHADDGGRLVDNVKQLDGLLFPTTDDTCRDSLETLAKLSRILRYVSASGQHLIQIVSWERHQKVDHPNKYTLPSPTADDYAQAQDTQGDTSSLSQVTRGVREARAKLSRDIHDTTNDQRPSTNDHIPRLTPRDMISEERKVFDHFLQLHPKRKMSEQKARRIIGARLKTFTPAELCTALDANASDPWHADRKKHELSYTLRDDEMVSGWLAKAEPRARLGSLDEGAVLRALGMTA